MLQERSSRIINLEDFQNTGGPLNLGGLTLTPPEEDQYILRMVIRANTGELYIPDDFAWTKSLIQLAEEHQKSLNTNHPFTYLTIRHGIVKSTEDDVWHVDGFSTKTPHKPEQNYLWVSDDAFEYTELSATIPDDFDPRRHNIHTYLAGQVNDIYKADDKTVYCMDPYILHRRPSHTTGQQRTFVRVSYVPIEINDIHNTQNPLLPMTYTDNGLSFRRQLLSY